MRDLSGSNDISLRYDQDLHATDIFDVAAKSGIASSFREGPPPPAGALVVDDAHLLFSGHFAKSGSDLVLSADGRSLAIPDYFRGEHHAPLYSPDGASLSGQVVDALVGHTAYAQAAPAPAAGNPIGHVAKLSGSAGVIRNGVTVELNVNDNVFKGDVVQAGPGSVLGISFVDGTAFSLGANARMVLNEMVYDPNGSSNSSFLSLIQGAITFVAGQTAKNGSMKIDTPVATMGIRGTAVLVEIAADNGPTRFSLLIEPGNQVGSYILYHKTSGQPLGTVSQAGMMTIITPAGFNQFTMTQQAKTLADISAVQDIIQQVFSIAFPKVNDANPKSRFGSVGSGVTPFGDLHFGAMPVFGPTELLKLVAAGSDPKLRLLVDDLFVHQKANTPPTIVVTNASAFQFGGVGNVETTQSPIPGDRTFAIADHVTIIDPDAGDLPQPYVPGTAQIVGVSGPPLPQGADIAALISVDPATGVVTYDPSEFRFLGHGEKIVYAISFDSKSGPDTLHETLLFTINGLDDAPEFGVAQIPASLAETAHQTGSGMPLAATFVLPFSDLDFNDTASGYTVTILDVIASGVTSGLPQAPADREAALRSFLSEQSLTKSFGATNGTLIERFSAPDKAFDYLAAGETLTLSYTIQVADAHGATDTETLTIIVTGTNDAPVLSADITGTHHLTEQKGIPATASGTLTFSDVDLSDTHHASVVLDSSSITCSGSGSIPQSTLAALASAMTVSLATGVPAGVPSPDSTGTGTGALTWTFSASDQSIAFLGAGQILTLTYDITVSDLNNGIPTGTSSTQSVTIVLTGVNDPASIGNPSHATVTQDQNVDSNGNLIAIGSIPINDLDIGQAAFQTTATAASGNLGSLTLNPDGSYVYTVANSAARHLGQGEIRTDTFTVTSIDGTTKDVAFVIHGINDPATIGEPTVACVTEDRHVDPDGNLIATGSIPICDPDTGQSVFQTTVTAACGNLGSLCLDADGSYTYKVSNSAVQSLGACETWTDTFTVTSIDGTTKDVAFVIHGVNDAPVLDTHDASLNFVAGQAPAVIDPSLTISDVDSDTLTGATIAITCHYHAGEDYLKFCDTTFSDGSRIEGTFDCTTGTLTLTGTASVADYQAALASVTYFNANDCARDDVRTVSFSVTDGSVVNGTSNVGTVNITVEDNTGPEASPDNIIAATHAMIQVNSHEGDWQPDGSHFAITLPEDYLLANDSVDSLPHLKDFPAGPAYGLLHDESGTFTYLLLDNGEMPPPDGTFTDSFTYRAADSHGTSDPAQVAVTIVNSDILTGTAHDDIIAGAPNVPERIEGLAGNDILIGGQGGQASHGDTFVFAPGSGHDTVIDFEPGFDRIELNYFTLPTGEPQSDWFTQWAASGAIVHQGSDTLINLNPNDPTQHDTILLKHVTNLSANDFVIHSGSSA